MVQGGLLLQRQAAAAGQCLSTVLLSSTVMVVIMLVLLASTVTVQLVKTVNSVKHCTDSCILLYQYVTINSCTSSGAAATVMLKLLPALRSCVPVCEHST